MKKTAILLIAGIIMTTAMTACTTQETQSSVPKQSKVTEQSEKTDVSEESTETSTAEASKPDESKEPDASEVSETSNEEDIMFTNVFGYPDSKWEIYKTSMREEPLADYNIEYYDLVRCYDAYTKDKQMNDSDFLTGKVIYEKEYVDERNDKIDELGEPINRKVIIKMDDEGNLLIKNANDITDEKIKSYARSKMNKSIMYAHMPKDLSGWINENFAKNINEEVKKIYIQTGIVCYESIKKDPFNSCAYLAESFPNLKSFEYRYLTSNLCIGETALEDITVPYNCNIEEITNCPNLKTIHFLNAVDPTDAFQPEYTYDDKYFAEMFDCEKKYESKISEDGKHLYHDLTYVFKNENNLKNLKTVYVPKGSEQAYIWADAKTFLKKNMNIDIEIIET